MHAIVRFQFPGIIWGKVKVMRTLEANDFWDLYNPALTEEGKFVF
jgi:hypothetical protein